MMIAGYDNSGGHIWNCDGITSYSTVTCFAAGACFDTRDELNMNLQFLHMNWGWYGDCDGYYSVWNHTYYNQNNKYIYNIRY